MKLGFTFDENILKKYTLNTFLNQLPYRVNHYEIAPDLDILSTKKYIEIVKTVDNHHYHVPYFVEALKYDFSHPNYKDHFEKLFIIIESLRQYSIKKPTIVIHGASQLSNNNAEFNTLMGLEFLLNFVERKSIDINLSLETLSSHSAQIGSRKFLKKALDTFQSDHLKICLDLCHDYFNTDLTKGDYQYPHELMSHINYVHLHGMKEHKHISIQHFPIEVIRNLKLDLDYTLELLIYQLKDQYTQILIDDLLTLK